MVAYNSSYAYTTVFSFYLLYYNGIIVRIGPGCVIVILTQPYQVIVTETLMDGTVTIVETQPYAIEVIETLIDGEVSVVESQKYQVTVTEFLCTG